MFPPTDSTPPNRKRLIILGSTGSIGRNALDVVRQCPDRFEVYGLAAHANIDLLAQQVREFSPKVVAVADKAACEAFVRAQPNVTVWGGAEGVTRLAAEPADLVLCAMVGALGLHPILQAIASGKTVAIANKEPLVMAGKIITEAAQRHGVQILPVDSEHSAIFQCLMGHERNDIYRIYLTASGGPFYGKDPESLARVHPSEAVRHPRWNMGAKVSVDSSTLMNKGLEIIEAMWLFNLEASKIDVLIHPESIVHGLVEFSDGHWLAHLSTTDMRFPIQFALTYPQRVECAFQRLDLSAVSTLHFYPPDYEAFPCLRYAKEAALQGGTAPALLNAANEVAVEAFMQHEIGFLDIARVVRHVLDSVPTSRGEDLDEILTADAHARDAARKFIRTRKQR